MCAVRKETLTEISILYTGTLFFRVEAELLLKTQALLRLCYLKTLCEVEVGSF